MARRSPGAIINQAMRLNRLRRDQVGADGLFVMPLPDPRRVPTSLPLKTWFCLKHTLAWK
jgi:hypothetical protein